MKPGELLTDHFRLTPVQKTALKRLGVLTIEDLLRHFPSRYERAGSSSRISSLTPGAKVTLFGTLSKLKAKKLWKSRRTATTGVLDDSSGKVSLMWFNQPYIASYYPDGSLVKLSGTVGGTTEKPYIANPEVEIVPTGSAVPGLFAATETDESKVSVFPIYPESRGITSLWFYHAVKRMFESGMHLSLSDPLPGDVRTKYNLPELGQALLYIHTPEKETHAEAARKRFAFEEIFTLQIVRAQEKARNKALPAFQVQNAGSQVDKFLAASPFPPTRAQRRAIQDIIADFEKPHPMARLLEGDVGAGKTLVAAATSYAVVTSRPPGRTSRQKYSRSNISNHLSSTSNISRSMSPLLPDQAA